MAALTKQGLYALVLNNLEDNTNIPAIEHREVEDNIIEAMLLESDFDVFYNAASKGAVYFFQTLTELNAFDTSGVTTGERAMVLNDSIYSNETTIYQWDGGSWAYVGLLSSLGINESNIVYITGTQTITGAKTFNVLPESTDIPVDGEDLTNKTYVDSAIASAGISGQTVKVSGNDTSARYLEEKITSADSKLTITTINDGADEDLQIQLEEGNITHNNLGGVSANEHIDHSTVSVVTGANSGLKNGGDLTIDRNLEVDINGTTAKTSADNADLLLIHDSVSGFLRSITRANFTSGITGLGETNTASNVGTGIGAFKQKNLTDLEFNSIKEGSTKIDVTLDAINNDVLIDVDETAVDHDNLLNFVSAEHVDHSSVSITAGDGLSGGGDITATKTIDVNITSEVELTAVELDDELLISDTSATNDIKKVTVATLLSRAGISSNLAQYWYNTINDQVAAYLYDNPANSDTKYLTKVEAEVGNTYELTKANFYYEDLSNEEATSPIIHVVRNRSASYVNVSTGTLTINPGDNDLLSIITTNSWEHGDYIEIYVDTGTGTSGGSQIRGYFSWSIKEV